MKKSNYLIVSLIIFSLAFSFSCKKDRIQQNTNEYDDINNYFNQKKQEEQIFVIDSGGSDPIIGNQGTMIWLSKECLQTPDGNSITWPFVVKLVELYKPKDMIYYQMPSVSSLGILETDGEIRLRAFKDSIELELKPFPCHCIVHMPNSNPKDYMKVFYGFQNNQKPDWTTNLSQFGISSQINPAFVAMSDTGYIGQIARLGWIGCDSLAGTTSGVKLNFVSSTDILDNVGIFIYFPNTRTVMQVYNQESTVFPSGSSVKLICIGIQSDGTLYKYFSAFSVSSNTEVEIEMEETTDAELTLLLNSL